MNTKLTLLTLTLLFANNLNCMEEEAPPFFQAKKIIEYDIWSKIKDIIIDHPDSPEIRHALEPYKSAICSEKTINKWTALHASVFHNKFYATKICLEFGNDVNTNNLFGTTPLHVACQVKAKTELVQALLDAGADLAAKNGYDKTPVQYARENKFLDLVTILENEPARRRWARRSDWLAAVVIASTHPKD